VDERLNDILAFAEIGQFIEQPVKTYSSGMVVRLAFAVAINVDPEILIVDEALSVGDELFQRKCFSRIEAIKKNGATILFVSHSGGTVVELCDRAILIDSGEKLAAGVPKQIIGRYQKMLYAPADKRDDIREQIRHSHSQDSLEEITIDGSTIKDNLPNELLPEQQESFDPNLSPSSTIEYESCGAQINAPLILTEAGEQVNNLIRGEIYSYTYTVHFSKSAINVSFGMMIKTVSGFELGGTLIKTSSNIDLSYVEAGTNYCVTFHFRCVLNKGVYYMNAGVAGSDGFLHRLVDVAMFRVIPENINFLVGNVDFNEYFELKLIQLVSDNR
jgi:lipopolysaccharide transport system ATP-binding protein